MANNFSDQYNLDDLPIEIVGEDSVRIQNTRGLLPIADPDDSIAYPPNEVLPSDPYNPEDPIVVGEPAETLPAPPTAHFVFTEFSELVVQFFNDSLGIRDSIFWDFGDGTTSTEENPTHTFPAGGLYEVRLTITNAGGSGIYTYLVPVTNPPPVTDFNYTVGGYTVYLTNTTTGTSGGWSWTFGDGGTSTEKNPKHTYTSSGDYEVTLKAGGVSVTKTISVAVEILLEWTDNADNEDGFKVERSPNGTDSWVEISDIEEADAESYGVTLAGDGVDPSVDNYFRVKAYNGAGDSGYSNTAHSNCGG